MKRSNNIIVGTGSVSPRNLAFKSNKILKVSQILFLMVFVTLNLINPHLFPRDVTCES